MAGEGGATVGSIVGHLRLDASDWSAELDRAGRQADELTRHNPRINIRTNSAEAIAQLEAVAVATNRLQTAQGKVSTAQAKLSNIQRAGVAAASELAKAQEALAKAQTEVDPARVAAAQERLTAVHRRAETTATAQAKAEEALSRAQTAGNPERVAAAEARLTAARERGQRVVAAQVKAEEALSRAQTVGDPARVAAAEARLTAARTRAGSVARAQGAAETALGRAMRDEETASIRLAAAHARAAAAGDDVTAANRRIAGSSKDASIGMGALIKSAVAIAPALIPIGAVAAGAFGAAALGGGALIAAIADIKNEMKQGTTLGVAYSNNIGTLKSDFAQLGHAAAGGLLGPFNAALKTSAQYMPLLRTEFGKFGSITGQVGANVATGLLGAFKSMTPLFDRLGAQAVDLSAKFAKFGAGGGFTKFTNYVLQNLPQVEHTLGELVQAIIHIGQAAASFGGGSLSALSAFSGLISGIPVGVLKTVAPLFLGISAAMKTLAIASSIQLGLRNMSTSLAAFSGGAAGATGRLAGLTRAAAPAATRLGAMAAGAATTIGVLGPLGVAVVGVGAAIAIGTKLFGHHGDAAKADAAQVQSLTEALINSKGAIDANVQAAAAQNLSNQGLLETGRKLGVQQADATARALGQARVNDSLTQQQRANATAIIADQNAIAQAQQRGDSAAVSSAQQSLIADEKRGAALAKYNKALDGNASSLKAAARTQKDLNAATTAGNLKQAQSAHATAAQLGGLGAKLSLTADQAKTYAAVLGDVADKDGNFSVSLRKVTADLATVSKSYNNATETGSAYLAALSTFAQSAGSSSDRAALLGATLKAANGDALNYATQMNGAAVANKQFVTDVQSAAKGIGKGGESTKRFLRSVVDLKNGTIDYNKAGAAPLLSGLQSIQSASVAAAQAVYQHAKETKGGKVAADEAYSSYVHLTQGALVSNFKQLGLNTDQAKRLAKSYLGMPKDIKSKIEAIGADPILTVLNKIGALLAKLTGQKWTTVLDADPTGVNKASRETQKRINAIKQGKVPSLNLNPASGQAELRKIQRQTNAIKQGIIPNLIVNTAPGRKQMKDWQSQIDRIKQNKVPGLDANSAPARARIAEIETRMNQFKQRQVPMLTVNTAAGRQELDRLQKRYDSIKQGKVPGLRINSLEANTALAATQLRMNRIRQQRTPVFGVLTTAAQAKLRTLQGQFDRVKQGKVPGLTANIANARERMGEMQQYMDGIRQHKVPVINANTAAGRQALDRLNARANAIRQGRVPVIGVRTLEANTAITNLENHLRRLHGKSIVVSVTRRGTVGTAGFNAQGNIYKAFAQGGTESHVAQIARPRPDTVRVWAEPETKGESYIPHANDSRRPRAHAIMAETAKLLGGTYTPYATGGITGNAALIARLLGQSGLGLTRNALAAILGNAKVESGLSPRATNAREGAHGLFQWEGGRANADTRSNSVTRQVANLVRELRGHYSSALRAINAAHTASGAAAAFDRLFEGSSGSTRRQRESAATAYARLLKSSGKGSWTVNGHIYTSATSAANAQASAAAQRAQAEHAAALANRGGYSVGGVMYATRAEQHSAMAAAANPRVRVVRQGAGAFLYAGQSYSTRVEAENARHQALQAALDARQAQAQARAQAALQARSGGLQSANEQFSALGVPARAAGTRSPAGQVIDQIRAYGRDTGRSTVGVVAALTRQNWQLSGAVKMRDSIEKRLAAANTRLADLKTSRAQEAATIRQATQGSFNIASTGYGDTGAIKAALQGKVKQALQFNRDLVTAKRKGVRQDLITQLAEAGADAGAVSAHTLAGASAADIRSINSLDRRLASTSSAIGNNVAGQMYDAGIRTAQGLVKGLDASDKRVKAAITRLADTMVAEIRRALGIHSPSTVMRKHGRFAAQGFALGLTDHVNLVKRGAASLAGAAIPINARGAGGFGSDRTSGPVNLQIDVHPAPGMDENRLAVLVGDHVSEAVTRVYNAAMYSN